MILTIEARKLAILLTTGKEDGSHDESSHGEPCNLDFEKCGQLCQMDGMDSLLIGLVGKDWDFQGMNLGTISNLGG